MNNISNFNMYPTITNTPANLDFLFSKLLILIALGAGFTYVYFSFFLYFRVKNLHRSLKTQPGEMVVMLTLGNLIISIIITILTILITVV